MTDLQKKMLIKIARSEYTSINGSEPNNYYETETWANVIIESAQDKGVFTSLVNADLAIYLGYGEDAGVRLTKSGFDAYKKIVNLRNSGRKNE